MFSKNDMVGKSNSLIAILSSDQAHEEVKSVVAKLPQVATSIKKTDDTLRDAAELVNGSADVVNIEADLDDPNSHDVLNQLCKYVSQSGFLIVLAENVTPASTRVLFKSGVNDVLPLPLDRAEFLLSLESAFGSILKQQHSAIQAKGKVISFMKCGGGVGATTIATNFAHTLITGGRPKKLKKNDVPVTIPRVAFLDLDVQFGTAALGLNLEGRSSIVDARRAEDRLDISLLLASMRSHSSGLNILASPDEIVPFTAFTGDFFDEIIEFCRSLFDYTIIDLPQAWTSWTHTVLDQSDVIVPVLKPNVENVHNAQKILNGLDHMKIGRDKTILAINQVAKGLAHSDRIGQIKKITDRPIIQIRDDQKTNTSARDRGMLLANVAANAPSTKDIILGTEKILKHLNERQSAPALGAEVVDDNYENHLAGQ